MMTDTYFTTKTWADVDSMNDYRRHPVAVTYSGRAYEKAFRMHIDSTDNETDPALVHEAFNAFLLVSAYHDRIYDRYMADALTEQRYDLLRAELADRDDPRADLEAVQ